MSAPVRLGLAAAMALIGTLAGPVPAGADNGGGMSWANFPGQDKYSTAREPYDRQFMKQWESAPPKGFPTLAQQNLDAMRAAIKLYSDVVAQGGFPTIPEINASLSLGLVAEPVRLVKQRLAMSRDLREVDNGSSNFDYELEKAVKRFQASNGLTPTGVVDKRTVTALNVPAQVRLRQLKVNLQRLTELSRTAGKRYIVVNIPAAQIEAVEGDRVVSRHAGVVGKIDRQTPILRSQIHELNFNPVWHLPPTVISKDLVPKGVDMQRRGQDVLAKYGIDAYDGAGRKVDSLKIKWSPASAGAYSFKQQPGPENPLGFVKINFHNAHSVYMHSTPSDSLFGRNFRAASSGCVRINNIDQLTAWIMAEQGWDLERVRKMKASGERLDVKLKRPIPLYFAYITAWATEDGVIQFRRDLYNKDGVGQIASSY